MRYEAVTCDMCGREGPRANTAGWFTGSGCHWQGMDVVRVDVCPDCQGQPIRELAAKVYAESYARHGEPLPVKSVTGSQ